LTIDDYNKIINSFSEHHSGTVAVRVIGNPANDNLEFHRMTISPYFLEMPKNPDLSKKMTMKKGTNYKNNRELLFSENEKIRIAAKAKMNMNAPKLYTKLEKQLYSLLLSLNMNDPLYAQYSAGPTLDYQLDAAIPNLGIGVEADGEIWHNNFEKITKDKKRDSELANNGSAIAPPTAVLIPVADLICALNETWEPSKFGPHASWRMPPETISTTSTPISLISFTSWMLSSSVQPPATQSCAGILTSKGITSGTTDRIF
jgi:hypothetical protein